MEIEVEWMARKREGMDSCQDWVYLSEKAHEGWGKRYAPTQAKTGLEWATCRLSHLSSRFSLHCNV